MQSNGTPIRLLISELLKNFIMEEILRLRIKNTESATVEIVPVDDGVEILVLRKKEPKKAKKYEFHDEREMTGNLEILRAFCTELKGNVDKGELKRFWEFYSGKMEEWKGTVQPEKLWARWEDSDK